MRYDIERYKECCGTWVHKKTKQVIRIDVEGVEYGYADLFNLLADYSRIEPMPEQCLPKPPEPPKERYKMAWPLLGGEIPEDKPELTKEVGRRNLGPFTPLRDLRSLITEDDCIRLYEPHAWVLEFPECFVPEPEDD